MEISNSTKIIVHAVVVLYKTEIDASTTIKSLQNMEEPLLALSKQYDIGFSLTVSDNSSEVNETSDKQTIFKEISCDYSPNQGNSGLAAAYNQVLDKLSDQDYLLLLDQDTHLSLTYFEELFATVSKNTQKVSVWVPRMMSEQLQISPIFSEKVSKSFAELPEPGVYKEGIMAINSASVFQAEVLKDMGGFSLDFPLDYLDHWVFFQLSQNNVPIQVLESQMPHQLSVMDYNTVSLQRYQSILDSEYRFYKEIDASKFSKFRFHLLLRMFKQLLKVKDKKIAHYTLKKFIKG
ncbi:glycosyltransferase family protein [Granulicatella seriolae]|uniref:Glycosyl transferase family 2 n=1 Tax=Granulicatella seriolae TaxID=2967226 RepID=A0ABT1WNY4_9LACT|nr:glycosyl transferase family 2 [Granulicatella seriolae]